MDVYLQDNMQKVHKELLRSGTKSLRVDFSF